MKKLLILLLSALSLTAFAQTETKRVAILETVDKENNVDYSKELLLRQTLTFAIQRTPGYEGYNRVDMKQIAGEHDFQRTGMVSDEQIRQLGQMTGAKYILIAEAANYGSTEILVLANLVDVESGEIVNSSIPKVTSMDSEILTQSCIEIAKTLLNIGGGNATMTSTTSYSRGNNSYSPAPAANQDFTETAWGINMKMIWVEGGDFLMGCTSEQGGDCGSDEQNVRRVTVDGFYIGMLEVTQSQWEKVVGTSIYQQKTKADYSNTYGVGPDYPMYYVSRDEAMEFCRLLSNKTGRTYTLPTEVQWEYAARGGNKNEGAKYAGSNMIDIVAWYEENSGGSTHIVGSKRANALGIYDMTGNVVEWCKGSQSYNPAHGIFRGGSFSSRVDICKVTTSFGNRFDLRTYDLGFRVVCLP